MRRMGFVCPRHNTWTWHPFDTDVACTCNVAALQTHNHYEVTAEIREIHDLCLGEE